MTMYIPLAPAMFPMSGDLLIRTTWKQQTWFFLVPIEIIAPVGPEHDLCLCMSFIN